MKNKKWLWGGLVVLLVVAVMSWGYRKYFSVDYLKMLPSRPKALVALDVARLLEETELDVEALYGISTQKWEEMKNGICWTKKIYAFVSSKEYLGILAAVDDAAELEKLLQKLSETGNCRPVEKRHGYSWTVFNERWLMGFDDHALIMMGPGYGGDMNVMRQEILKCFGQRKEESGQVSVLYKNLESKDAAFAFIARMDMLPVSCGKTFQAGLPEHANLNDINILATVQFEKDGVALNAELNSSNPNVNRYYERISHISGNMSGVYADNVPEDALAWGAINMNGDSLLEHLRAIPDVRTFLLGLNMGVDADRMIRSIDGDMAVTLLAPNGMKNMDYLVTAQIKNSDFLEEADYWTESAARNSLVTLYDQGNHHFFISTLDLKAFFGVEDETLYLTSSSQAVPNERQPATGTLAAWKEDIMSDCFFFWLNLEQLKRQPEMGTFILALNGSSWKETVDLFSSITIQSSDVCHMKLKFNTKDNQPVLESLLKQWIK